MSSESSVLWISVDKQLFSESVVIKAVYWLAGRYGVELRSGDALLVGVAHPTGCWTESESRQVEARLRRDLIDFRTRELVDAETRSIRELLVAKAFAATDSVDRGPGRDSDSRQ